MAIKKATLANSYHMVLSELQFSPLRTIEDNWENVVFLMLFTVPYIGPLHIPFGALVHTTGQHILKILSLGKKEKWGQTLS